MAPRSKKGEVSFSGTDVRSRFAEALGQMKLEDHEILKRDVREQFIPSGSVVWDEVCRLRGICRNGRVILCHGKEHGGKSTMAYFLAKNYQQATGEPAVIFDFERTCSLEYLEGIGVDTSEDMLRVFRPKSLQDGIQKAMILMKAGVKFFIWDSISRMKDAVDEKEVLNGDAFKASMGTHAKAMNRFFDILLPYAAQYDAVFIMVGQHQARVGDNSMEAQLAQKYPSMTNHPYILPGGNQVRYVPSISIEVTLAKAYRAGGGDDDFLFEGTEDKKGDFVVNKVKMRVLKNKVTPGGFREAVLWIRPGKGIDDDISVRELARHYDLISPVGRKWRVGTEDNPLVIFDNKDQALDNLVENPDRNLLAKLRELVIQAIRADKGGFAAELSDHDKFIAGECDEDALVGSKTSTFRVLELDDPEPQ